MEENLSEYLLSLAQTKKSFGKGQFIYLCGDIVDGMGIVLKGSVQIEQNDFWGNRTIIDIIEEGGFFAETFAITGDPMMVDVKVSEKCEIAFVNIKQIMNGSDPDAKIKLTQTLLNICSKKNIRLSQKIMFTSSKTIRSRLNAYLSYQSKINDSMEFDIPFDRQQMADYLNLDRSAMSSELSRMAREGLLETKKNHFILKKIE